VNAWRDDRGRKGSFTAVAGPERVRGVDRRLRCRVLCGHDEQRSVVSRDDAVFTLKAKPHLGASGLCETAASSCAMGNRRTAIEPPSLGPI
jgi:hypothetical protein